MVIRFEWDPVKADANFRKHAISFEHAQEGFNDPYGLDEVDDKDAYGEERFNLTGMAKGRLIVVSYTQRIDERNRRGHRQDHFGPQSRAP